MAVTFPLGRAFLPALAETFEVLGPQLNGHVYTEKKEGATGQLPGLWGLSRSPWGNRRNPATRSWLGLCWVSVGQEVYMEEKQMLHVFRDGILTKEEESLFTLDLGFPRATGILCSLMRVRVWAWQCTMAAVLQDKGSREAHWAFWVVIESQGKKLVAPHPGHTHAHRGRRECLLEHFCPFQGQR